MRIWIVRGCIDYEGDDNLKAFTSEAQAEAYKESLMQQKHDEWGYDEFKVDWIDVEPADTTRNVAALGDLKEVGPDLHTWDGGKWVLYMKDITLAQWKEGAFAHLRGPISSTQEEVECPRCLNIVPKVGLHSCLAKNKAQPRPYTCGHCGAISVFPIDHSDTCPETCGPIAPETTQDDNQLTKGKK